MRTPVLLAAGALALTGLFTPATAATPLVTQDVYFHCPAGAKVLNAAPVAGTATWDTRKPTASLTTGAGCGFADPGPLTGTAQTSIYDANIGGRFTGDLDSLTVSWHDINVGPTRSGAPLQVDVRLVVDGQSMFGSQPSGSGVVAGDVPRKVRVPVTVKPSASGASSEVSFTITGLGFLTPPDAEPTEPVDHQLLLTVEGASDLVSGWVMDTSETPSGITFNPATPAAATVRATTPGPLPVEEF